MDRAKLLAAIETALSEVLEREVTGLTEDTRLFEDVHLDSTSVLELLMARRTSSGSRSTRKPSTWTTSGRWGRWPTTWTPSRRTRRWPPSRARRERAL
jgi:hypothetical protein